VKSGLGVGSARPAYVNINIRSLTLSSALDADFKLHMLIYHQSIKLRLMISGISYSTQFAETDTIVADSKKCLRDLLIPVTFSGEPLAVLKQIQPIVALALSVTAYIELREPRALLLASSLWGLAPIIRSVGRLKILVSTPNSPNFGDMLIQDWNSKRLDPYILRLSILRNLQDQNRLSVFVSTKATPKGIYPILGNESSVRIIEDRTGTLVAYGVSLSEETSLPLVKLHFWWSFGDPNRIVFNARSAIDEITSDVCHYDASVKSAIEHIISSSEILPLQWAESCDGPKYIPTAIQLFAHQRKAIDAWCAAGDCGIFRMCTGAGKTVASITAAKEFYERFANRDDYAPTLLVTVPTRVLADQWINELERLGLPNILRCYEAANNWIGSLEAWIVVSTAKEPRILVTTYRTFADPRFLVRLKRAYDQGGKLLWIADEMHNLGSAKLLAVMDGLSAIASKRIGLSATPEIEDNYSATERLQDFFHGIVATYDLKDGISDGVLCPYRYYPQPAYLNPGLGSRYLEILNKLETSGTNSVDRLELFRESRELIRMSGVQIDAFKRILDLLANADTDLAHTLIYCPPGYANVEESDGSTDDPEGERLIEQVVRLLRDRGISPASILGSTPAQDRKVILERFASGETSVLCAIGCLDEGIDVPSIKRAIILYSIDRLRQFVQRRGRILRVPKGIRNKIAEIYDIVVLPHGSPLSETRTEEILSRELRRYREFADLALNQNEAAASIHEAMRIAISHSDQN